MRRVIEIGDGGKDIFLEAILWRGEMGPESERSLLNKARELRFLEGSFHKTHAIKNLSSVS